MNHSYVTVLIMPSPETLQVGICAMIITQNLNVGVHEFPTIVTEKINEEP